MLLAGRLGGPPTRCESSSGALLPGAERPLPVLAGIAGVGSAWAMKEFGSDLASPTWHTLSPISQIDRITAPVLVTCSTADLLCTIEQFTRHEWATRAPALFPKNYKSDLDELALCAESRRSARRGLVAARARGAGTVGAPHIDSGGRPWLSFSASSAPTS